MLDKKYLEKFSSEKERLTPVKVELSSLDELIKGMNDMNVAEGRLDEVSGQALKVTKLLAVETTDAKDILDKVTEVTKALKDLIESAKGDYEELFDTQNTAYGMIEKYASVNMQFQKNANALGLDVKSIGQWNDFVQASDDLIDVTEAADNTINDVLDTIDEAKDILNKL